jgi:hypothetical protein
MRKTPEEIADEYMAEARKAGFRPKAKDAEKASAGGKSWKDGGVQGSSQGHISQGCLLRASFAMMLA